MRVGVLVDGTVFQHNWFSSFSLIFYLGAFKNIILQRGSKIAKALTVQKYKNPQGEDPEGTPQLSALF